MLPSEKQHFGFFAFALHLGITQLTLFRLFRLMQHCPASVSKPQSSSALCHCSIPFLITNPRVCIVGPSFYCMCNAPIWDTAWDTDMKALTEVRQVSQNKWNQFSQFMIWRVMSLKRSLTVQKCKHFDRLGQLHFCLLQKITRTWLNQAVCWNVGSKITAHMSSGIQTSIDFHVINKVNV